MKIFFVCLNRLFETSNSNCHSRTIKSWISRSTKINKCRIQVENSNRFNEFDC